MLRRKIALAVALCVTASLVLAGAVVAGDGDRNKDRIPDRWEKRHNLSLKVKQHRRDQDSDGLKNRGEWRAKLDPRDDDTDDDGIEDGDENAGTVASFEDDVLTLDLAGGGTLSALVDRPHGPRVRRRRGRTTAATTTTTATTTTATTATATTATMATTTTRTATPAPRTATAVTATARTATSTRSPPARPCSRPSSRSATARPSGRSSSS